MIQEVRTSKLLHVLELVNPLEHKIKLQNNNKFHSCLSVLGAVLVLCFALTNVHEFKNLQWSSAIFVTRIWQFQNTLSYVKFQKKSEIQQHEYLFRFINNSYLNIVLKSFYTCARVWQNKKSGTFRRIFCALCLFFTFFCALILCFFFTWFLKTKKLDLLTIPKYVKLR